SGAALNVARAGTCATGHSLGPDSEIHCRPQMRRHSLSSLALQRLRCGSSQVPREHLRGRLAAHLLQAGIRQFRRRGRSPSPSQLPLGVSVVPPCHQSPYASRAAPAHRSAREGYQAVPACATVAAVVPCCGVTMSSVLTAAPQPILDSVLPPAANLPPGVPPPSPPVARSQQPSSQARLSWHLAE